MGAFERYGVLGCAWGTWSVFQALAHIRHAFENFWSKNGHNWWAVDQSVPGGCKYFLERDLVWDRLN